jgi:hypothetical protein
VNAQAIRNRQRVFRQVNERIADIMVAQDERANGFLCECAGSSCTSILELPLTDYRAVREEGDTFLVAAGHSVDGVDRLVESRDGFDLVEQV